MSSTTMGGTIISDTNRLLYLRIALIVFGLTFTLGIYPLGIVWPSGWAWGHGHSHYLMMIVGVYATLGVFLILASRNPDAHRSIIWFTVWSSVVHGTIMGVQSFNDAGERGHLLGDVPALFLVAIILAALMPRTASAASRGPPKPSRASRWADMPRDEPSAWHRWKEIAPTAMPAAQACGAATSHQAESGIGDRYAAVPTHPDGTIKD